MDNKLPLRLMVLTHMNTVPETTIKETMEVLQDLYGSERQFTYKNFVGHFLALKENGLINDIKYDLDENQKLNVHYAINDDGKDVLTKYGR